MNSHGLSGAGRGHIQLKGWTIRAPIALIGFVASSFVLVQHETEHGGGKRGWELNKSCTRGGDSSERCKFHGHCVYLRKKGGDQRGGATIRHRIKGGEKGVVLGRKKKKTPTQKRITELW